MIYIILSDAVIWDPVLNIYFTSSLLRKSTPTLECWHGSDGDMFFIPNVYR